MASSSPIEIKSSPPPAGLKIKLNAGLAKREPSAGTSSAGARDVIEIDDSEPDEVANGVKTEQAKVRHEADLKKHHYEPPKADRVQDDWQVAYVWAFIMKFHQIERIRKLESIHDFERCLMEPVANRPDDVLEGILIRFLSNLKPGLRNLDCTNIQHHLSAYVTDQLLNSNEFTVWDRPWAPNEEARGSCCTNARDREELGRLRYSGEPASERAGKNPIAQVEQRGGGLFELDWRERTKLLRQLVDWQLAHAESIKPVINIEYKLDAKGAKKVTTATTANDPEESIVTIPLGQDRDKNRIWAFDHSGRLYKSGNPFKRPCPLVAISTTRAEFDVQLQEYQAHGAQKPEKPKGSGVKGKMSKQETVMYRKLLKGIEDEKQLAAKVEELVPLIEKEEARIQRARKRIAAANELAQMAEVRSTRTRRTTRKVDYTYDGDEEEPEDNKRSKGNNGDWEGSSTRGRLVIPGERRSARTSGRGSNGQDDGASDAAEIEEVTEQRRNGTDGDHTMTASGSGSLDLEDVEGFVSAPAAPAAIGAAGKPKKAAAKGYAWVTEFVPESELTPKDRAALAKNSAATPGDGWANGHSSQEGAAAANPPEGQVNHGDPMEVKDGPPVIAEGPP